MNLKKLLSTIGIISATITTSLNLVACKHTNSDNKSIEETKYSNENIEIIEDTINEITQKNTNLSSPKQINKLKVTNKELEETTVKLLQEINENIESFLAESKNIEGMKPEKNSLPIENPTISQKENIPPKINESDDMMLKNNINHIDDYEKINPFEQNKYENERFSPAEINAINTIKNSKFSITIPKEQEARNLYNQINGNFISSQLSYGLKKELNLAAFKIEDIIIHKNNWPLIISTKDLNKETTLEANINFYYKKEKYQVPLTINIVRTKEILAQDIVQITHNFIALKKEATINTNTDGRINILSSNATAKYISHLISYIDFHKEAKYKNTITNVKDLQKIIKTGMKNYFAKNDESLIKNIFKPKKLKIKTIYIKKNEQEKMPLTNAHLNSYLNEPLIKIVVGFTYENIEEISNEITLSLVSTTLYDEKNNETIIFVA